MVQVVSFALSAILTIPRVRTYHTKKPSRFVHALSARPLKVHGGRGSNMCADGMESVFFIFDVCYTPTLSCRGRRDGSQSIPLFVLFVLFGQAKRTLKEKNHKVTFLLSYFSSLKSTARQLPLTPARSCRSTSCISCRCRRGMGHFCLFSRI